MNFNIWLIFYDWIFILCKIDSAVRCNIGEYPTLEFKDSYHTCGVFVTLAFFFINSVSNSRLNDDFYEGVRFNLRVVQTQTILFLKSGKVGSDIDFKNELVLVWTTLKHQVWIYFNFRVVLDLVEQKYGSLLVFFAPSDLSLVSLTHFGRVPLYQQYTVIFSLFMDFVWRLRIQYSNSFGRWP